MPVNQLQLAEIGTPRVPQIDFSSLAELPQVFREAQKRQVFAELGQQLQSGNLNYEQAAGKIASLAYVGAFH